MGHTNRKKFEDLLNEVSNSSQQQNSNEQPQQFDNNNTFQESHNQGEQSSSEDTTTDSLNVKYHRVPDMDWEPKSNLKVGGELVRTASEQFIGNVQGKFPTSGKPDLRETCLFVPAVKRGISGCKLPPEEDNAEIDSDKINATEIASKDYLLRGHSFQKIRLYASVLESYNIPWTISKYKLKIRSEGEVYAEITAIVEFGITYTGNSPESELEWEVRHNLEQTAESMAVESHFSRAEHTHEKDGIYYFPIGSNFIYVAACGVFNNSSLMNHQTSHDVLEAEHMEILKQGSRR
jgi:hypothetical protein